jgi:hypothetical protein
VIDNPKRAAGQYWTETLPRSRAEWRRDFAVLVEWNENGQYVEYTVPTGPGLRVWRGQTAAQDILESDHFLPGGAQQIWMPPKYVVPDPARPTGW